MTIEYVFYCICFLNEAVQRNCLNFAALLLLFFVGDIPSKRKRGNFSSFASPRGSGASLFRALPGRTPLAAAKHHPGNPFASLSKHCATRKN